MNINNSTLRLHAHGGIELYRIRQLLKDVENSYLSINLFTSLFDPEHKDRFHDYPYYLVRGRILSTVNPNQSLVDWSNESGNLLTNDEDVLILKAVRLESPGSWDFLGKMNPLEVMRQYLNDRHERRKDQEYRESAESRRMELENLKLENEVVKSRLEIAASMGFSKEELAPTVSALLTKPLRELDKHQDSGLIENAEILERDDSYFT